MEDVVDVAGDLRYTVGNLWSNACRRDLLHLTIVLGIIVEELVARHHLGDGEDDSLLAGFIDTLRNLRTFEITLDHNLRTLQHRLADGRSQLVLVLHLGYAKRRSVSSRLDEARHANALLDFIVAHQFLVTLANQQGVGHADTITAQILIEHELIESHSLHQHTTGTVGQIDQIEVTLQQAVLTRSAMNGDIGIVE